MQQFARAFLATALAACLLSAAAGSGAIAAAGRAPADVQGTYDRQPLLLDRAFARLQPAAAPGAQLYFIGFAGYGGEAVFKREVLAVRQQFDERFGTRGKS